MTRRLSALVVGLFLVLPSFGLAQVPPDKVLSTFTVTDKDLEISLWASEPLLANPTCMDIDHKGRVWVCESVNYRESLADQEALVFLGTDDCAKLWVNGQLVYINRKHRVAVPEEDSATVKLKKGGNTVLFKINNGDGPHGFYLTFQAEQELKRREDKHPK